MMTLFVITWLALDMVHIFSWFQSCSDVFLSPRHSFFGGLREGGGSPLYIIFLSSIKTKIATKNMYFKTTIVFND